MSELLTPADIEQRYRMPGGHWHHGELQADQMLMSRPVFGAEGYDTPIDGLYLAGAGSHPGGGISGAPGLQRGAAHPGDGGAKPMGTACEQDRLIPMRSAHRGARTISARCASTRRSSRASTR